MNDNNPYKSNPMPPGQQEFQAQPQQGDATGGVIPYKNVPALIGYYTGIFSLLPCLGFPLGFVAVVLGIMGLRAKSKNPAVKGTAHAVVALVCGILSIFGNGAGWAIIIAGMMSNA